MSERARFVVTFTSAPGINGVRSLRALLKNARRHFGLIAIDAREETASPAPITYTQIFNELRRSVAARRAARTPPHHEQMED
jgi:hypothetical protein